MTRLRLSAADLKEYSQRCLANETLKQACIASGDAQEARKARQANTRLYKEYELKQLPEELPEYAETHRNFLTLEMRIRRVEIKLGLL